MMKKTVSLFLAMMMVLALAIPAFASGSTGSDSGSGSTADPHSWGATAVVKIPEIAVDLPNTTGSVFVNPFGFKVVTSSGEAATQADVASTAVEKSSEKIVSPVYTIVNRSPMALDVGLIASAAINTGSTMTLNANPLSATSTKKEAFIYVQFVPTGINHAAVLLSKETGDDKVPLTVTKTAYATATEGVGDDPEADGYVAPVTAEEAAALNLTNHLVAITTKAPTTPVSVGTLAASTAAEESDETAVNGVIPSYMGFQFFGDAVTNPKEAWKTSGDGADGVTISMVFSFNPA